MKWLKQQQRNETDAAGVVHRTAPAVILLASFALRVWRLGDANLWWDEALAVWGVRKGLLGVTLWTASDVHPPLYFWSLWGWVQLVGESEFAIRMLSVLFGVLTVAVVYSLGTLVAGRVAGSLAALLTGLSRFHVWWSQETRMYVLAALAGALSLYLFLRWLRAEIHPDLAEGQGEGGQPSRKPWVWLMLYVLASTAAVYTVLLMGAVIMVENVVLLLALWGVARAQRKRSPRVDPFGSSNGAPTGGVARGQRKGLFWRWAVAQLSVLALVAVWMAFSWGRMHTWSVAEPMDLLLYLRLYATLLTTGVSVDIGRYTWALVLPFAVLLAGLVLFLRGREQKRWRFDALAGLTLALAVVVPAVAIFVATLPRGFFYTPKVEARYFLPFAPAFWVLLGWALVLVARRWRMVGSIAGVALVGLWIGFLPGHYTDRYLDDELQSMVRAILSQAEEGDVVLLDSGSRYPLFLYYYDAFRGVARPPMLQIPPGEGNLTADRLSEVMEPIAGQYDRIWLAEVDANLNDPDRLAERWLAEHYARPLQRQYGSNSLHLFAAPDDTPTLADNGYTPQYVANRGVGGDGHLAGWELPVATYRAGETIHLGLLWERVPEGLVEVALRPPGGQMLQSVQLPAPTERERQRQQVDFPVYAATPAGEYEIVLSTSAEQVVLGSLRIAGTTALPRGQTPEVVVNAQLGEGITLLGYTLRDGSGRAVRTMQPGETLRLDLYWRAEYKPERNYTVFTHLLCDAFNPRTQGPVWGQHDAQPADNGYPTTQWLEGTVIVDRHLIDIQEDAPPGSYTIEVGMYGTDDGARLVVHLGGQPVPESRVLLETQVQVTAR